MTVVKRNPPAGQYGLRTIGTGATEAAAGNHTHTESAGGDLTGTYPNPTVATGVLDPTNFDTDYVDGVDANASLRTLGTGSAQAAKGNHSHGGGAGDATSLQGVSIDATLDTTDGYVLTYVTADSELQLLPGGGGGGGADAGANASRPAAGNDGTLYLPTDGRLIYFDNGSVWSAWGPLYALTQPQAASNWGNGNFGGVATLTDNVGGLLLTTPSGSQNVRRAIRNWAGTIPSTPYTVRACFKNLHRVNSGNQFFGLYLRSTGDNKLSFIGIDQGQQLFTGKFNSDTSYNANYTSSTLNGRPDVFWLVISDDGSSNRKYGFSWDGALPDSAWTYLTTVTHTDFHTPDEIGFFVDPAGNGALSALLLSWAES